jgi:5'-3' exonuclease
MTVLIIDGDTITFRMAASCEPNKTKLERDPLHAAIHRIDGTMRNIFESTGADKYEFYIKGDGNFRKTLYPLYKANRTDKVPPMWLEDCREYVITKYNAKIVNDVEVDDMCGIRMSYLHTTDVVPVCVSLDKDLLQIPGKHYNFVKQEFNTTTAVEGLRIFYKQIILGDLSDNVPGYDGKYRSTCPKFIDTMQRPLDELSEEAEMYDHVCDVYGGDVATVNLHAQLLYVLRKENEFWLPPK